MFIKLILFCAIAFVINFAYNEGLRLEIRRLKKKLEEKEKEHVEDAKTFLEAIDNIRG